MELKKVVDNKVEEADSLEVKDKHEINYEIIDLEVKVSLENNDLETSTMTFIFLKSNLNIKLML